MENLGPNALIAAIVLPLFYLCVYADYAWARRQGRADYEIKDTVGSLGVSLMMSALGVLTLALRVAIYTLVYQAVALAEWSLASPWTWILGLLLYDFSYYWQHRMGHELNLLWASHVVHHSSERFNLATALRVPAASMNLWTWIFALPLAVAGVPPVVYAVASLVNLLYQFWIHTERIGSLGFFDRCFGSPSNHRVHHGINTRYLDKNYGGILMLWDHLFGTFQEERRDDPVRYGTRAPVRSFNPLWINLDTLVRLFAEARRATRWRDRLQLWLRPPGWRPADVAAADPQPPFRLEDQQPFDTETPRALARYALLQSFLLWPPMVHLIAHGPTLAWSDKIGYALWISLGAIALGLLIDGRRSRQASGLVLELARIGMALALLGGGYWFAPLPAAGGATHLAVLLLGASLPLLAWSASSLSGLTDR